MSRFGGTDVRIRSLLLQQTGTFHQIYNRPFNMSLDDRMRDTVRERIANTGTGVITNKSFRGISASILSPVAKVDTGRDGIDIPDGWDRPRCRFMMEVSVKSGLGGDETFFLQGFSDYLGLTSSGNIDHQMVFYINGIIGVQYATRNTRFGEEEFAIVRSSAQVINGRLIYDRDNEVSMTRTTDLFSDMQRRFYDSGFAEGLDDTRSRLQSPADSIFAERGDNLPGNYLGSALSTFRRNTSMSAFGSDSEDVYARTQQELSSNLELIRDNSFLRALSTVKDEVNATSFTIDDLLDLDPGVSSSGVIQGGKLSGRALDQLAHNSETVSHWRSATTEAMWATQLSNTVSAVMMGNFYRFLHFRADNYNIDHRIVVNIVDSEAVASSMPREIFERMIDSVEDILFDMSAGNRDDFKVDVKASLYDQTELFISVNGSREQRFFVPSFADGLMTPFYSRDSSILESLSSDVEGLINDMSSELSGSSVAVARGI